MRLIGLAVTLTVSLILAPLAGEAQRPPGKTARIGLLFFVPSPFLDEAFRQGLRELGYVEGQNIAIEYRSAEGKDERLSGRSRSRVTSRHSLVSFRIAAPADDPESYL